MITLVRSLLKMRFVKDKILPACVKGKQTKSSFKPNKCSSITVPFHPLHVDLFGPIPVESHAGK